MSEVDLEKLVTAYNQITDRIIEITLSPKPNYDIDGQKISWGDYLKTLTMAQDALRKQLAEFQELYEIPNDTIS